MFFEKGVYMSAFNKAQLAKLSPAERRARAQRLEYNRKYDAAKKRDKVKAKTSVKKAVKIVTRNAPATSLTQLEVLFVELKDTRAKAASITQEIRSLLENLPQ